MVLGGDLMKVKVSKDSCIVPKTDEEDCQDAIESCPTGAIVEE